MEELEFNRMIYAIVSGLYEKEQNTDKYPYSEHLLYGINMFAALAFQQKQIDILSDLHEATFICKYATKPVREWFYGWNSDFIKMLSGYSLFNTGALIKMYDSRIYSITDDCEDLYSNTENDMFNALEQNQIYQMMRELEPEHYTSVRRFIVQNPVCSEKELRTFKMHHNSHGIQKIIKAAYEDIPENSYRCPVCGWTMTFHGHQAFCCNQSCTEANPVSEQLKLLNSTEFKRLRHGIMRYMCLPGKLELEIQAQAEKYGCKTELWPEKDKYDIKIIFDNGTVWAIDAKTHRNPYTLASSIKADNMFANISADKRFYVIPEKRIEMYADYCDICKTALSGKNVKCITDRELYQMIRREKENGSD